jgi:O-antigen/teichoic acid export membrane protein
MLKCFFTPTAKKGYIALIDQGFVSGANFLTGVLLARLCTKEEYGLYVLAFSLLLFWDGFRNSLVASPLVVYLPRKGEKEQSSYIGSSTVLHALVFLAGAVVFGAAAGIIKLTGDAPLAAVVLAGILTLCGYSSREHVRRVFYAQLRTRRAALVDGVYCLLQLGALVVLWRYGMLSAVNALLALGGAQTAAALAGLLLLSKSISFRNLNLRSAFSLHWKLGKWLVATSLAYAVATQIYPWALKYTSSLESVAIFGACMVPILVVNPIIIGFNNVLAPRLSHVFAQEGIAGLRRVVWKSQVILGGLLTFIALFTAIFSRVILELMYGGKYSEYNTILTLLAIRLVMVGFAAPLLVAFLIMEKPKIHFYVTIVSAICTLSVGLSLVCFFGVAGAALGMILAGTCNLTVLVLFYRKYVGNSAGPV